MNKQQTAVEWLIEQLQKTRDWQRVINEANQSSTSVRDVIKEAKEMEKEYYTEFEVLQLLLKLQQTESYDNLYDWFQENKKQTFNTKQNGGNK
jgi:hypothetical protein